MKILKLNFLLITALVAMSFTILPHSNLFKKKALITFCYSTLTVGEWIQDCVPTYQPINKANYPAEVNQYVRNNLNVGGYITFPAIINCNGGNAFCCMQFSSTPIDKCLQNIEQKGNGSFQDVNGNIIANTNYVKIYDVFLKP